MRLESIAQLLPDPENPREIDADSMAGLRVSEEEFGDLSGIVWNSRTGQLVCGHQRFAALQEIGRARGVDLRLDVIAPDAAIIIVPATAGNSEIAFPVRVVDWPIEKQRSANIAANNPHISGRFTPDIAGQLDDLRARNSAMFEALRLHKIEIPKLPDPPSPDPDPPGGSGGDPAEDPWSVQLGDIWKVPSLALPGWSHRIVCGDCRHPSTLPAIAEHGSVTLVFTSPPYAAQRTYDPTSGFEQIPPDEYVAWFEAVQSSVHAVLATNGSFFVNLRSHCEDGERHLYPMDLVLAMRRQWGWKFVDDLVWHKTALPGAWPNRLRNAWEPVYHFARQMDIVFNPKAASHAGTVRKGKGGLGKTKASAWTIDTPREDGDAQPGNVIKVSTFNSDGANHAAAFPPALAEFFVLVYSGPGQTVCDPFSGSGSTLLACERQRRIFVGSEISPAILSGCLSRLARAGLSPVRP